MGVLPSVSKVPLLYLILLGVFVSQSINTSSSCFIRLYKIGVETIQALPFTVHLPIRLQVICVLFYKINTRSLTALIYTNSF